MRFAKLREKKPNSFIIPSDTNIVLDVLASSDKRERSHLRQGRQVPTPRMKSLPPAHPGTMIGGSVVDVDLHTIDKGAGGSPGCRTAEEEHASHHSWVLPSWGEEPRIAARDVSLENARNN